MRPKAYILNAAILVFVCVAAVTAQSTEIEQLRLEAEQGDAGVQYNLGVMYANGRGVPQDHQEAVKWYRLAAEQGNADAQNSLGLRYFIGSGVPQDHQEAVKWYRLAAEQGHAIVLLDQRSGTALRLNRKTSLPNT